MFPWGKSDNPLESLFKKPSLQLYEQNPIISKQDDCPFFSNFPSPFFDEHELPLNQILPHFQIKPGNPPDQTAHNTSDHSPKKETPTRTVNNGASSKLKEKASADQPIANCHVAPPRRRNLSVAPRKRTGKKDRHSKICTAQGIRDRRMRLSLQVARKFFDLQDMLGYDKASKTIEWLFNRSKKAIKELIKENTQGNNDKNISISDAKSESFISECEVVSGTEENSNNEIKEGVVPHDANPLCIKGCEKKPRKTANVRESREKARARARSRTKEKMMIKGLEMNSGQWCCPIQDDLQKLGSSKSPFDQEPGPVNQKRASPYNDAEYSPLVHQSSDVGTIETLLGNYHCSGGVSSSIDPNSNFMGFLGNWDLLNNDRLNSSHYAVTNQLAGNPNSIYSETSAPDFPLFDHQ